MTGARRAASLARIVVFSKDRPLQLDATLRSFARHCGEADDLSVVVLYATSSARQHALYHELSLAHPDVAFRRERRFKRDLQLLISDAPFVGLVVDDSLFVRDFSFRAVVNALNEDERAIGFSLRLGRNTSYCYPLDALQEIPAFSNEASGILSFRWPGASHDFGYPLELSSSVYRTRDLLPLLRRLRFSNPNTLEAQLAAHAGSVAERRPMLLCFERSVAFSVPANVVQDVSPNRISGMANQSSNELASAFERGGRIDITRYDDFENNACHEEIPLYINEPNPPPPTVSVIIPCFQQAQYLADAVSSVVAQTWTDWETVIVDDGSTDDTADCALALIEAYPDHMIRLMRQGNEGLANARNNGIAASTGRYILPLDADDMLAPSMLERTVAVLAQSPEIAIAYTDVQRFGAADGVIRAADFDPDLIPEANQLNYCSLYRRGVWHATGGYNPNMVHGYEDWDFWVGCVERGYVARRIPESLFIYRVRPGSMFAHAVAHDAELRRQLRRNHPRLYSLRSTVQRRSRVTLRNWARRLQHVLNSDGRPMRPRT